MVSIASANAPNCPCIVFPTVWVAALSPIFWFQFFDLLQSLLGLYQYSKGGGTVLCAVDTSGFPVPIWLL